MRDLKFTKEHVSCDFEEAAELENIRSGESLGVIFGKIQKWINSIGTVESGLSEVVTLPDTAETVNNS